MLKDIGASFSLALVSWVANAGTACFSSSMKRSIGSKPRASPSACNCGMEGVYSCDSNLLSIERFMPVRSASSACVIFNALRREVTVSERRTRDSFFMGVSWILLLGNIFCCLMLFKTT